MAKTSRSSHIFLSRSQGGIITVKNIVIFNATVCELRVLHTSTTSTDATDGDFSSPGLKKANEVIKSTSKTIAF